MRSRMLLCMPDARLAVSGSPQPTLYMDNQAQLWIDAPRFQFFVYFSCRVGGLIYHDNKIDALAIFSYYVCVVLVMVALYIASLSGRLQNMVCIFFISQTHCNFLCKHFSSSKARAQKNMSISEQLVATCSGFPLVAEQVANTCHCIAYSRY
jgi:hypothetical protein